MGSVPIPAISFKDCLSALAAPLTRLFNLCLEKSVIPQDWKTAIVRPHYKGKGNRLDPDSYRPISILPVVAKVFESVIVGRISSHFELHNIFRMLITFC